MARVTPENCLKNKKITSHFELVLLASRRARAIESGESPKLELHKSRSSIENINMSNNSKYHSNSSDSRIFLDEKSVVIALREIEKDLIDLDLIKQQMRNDFVADVMPYFVENVDVALDAPNEGIESQSSLIDEESFYISPEDWTEENVVIEDEMELDDK